MLKSFYVFKLPTVLAALWYLFILPPPLFYFKSIWPPSLPPFAKGVSMLLTNKTITEIRKKSSVYFHVLKLLNQKL